MRGDLVIKHTLVRRIDIDPVSFTLRMLPDDTMYLQFLQDSVNSRWGNAYLLCQNKGACHKGALHHAVHLFCIASACGRHFLRVSCFFDSTEKQSPASRNPIWIMLRQDWQQEENGYRGKD